MPEIITARAAVDAPTYRRAGADDVTALAAMLREFVTSTKYRKFVGANRKALEDFLFGLLLNPNAAIFVAARGARLIGMIGVLAYVHPMSAETCAGELFWWLDPAQRGAGGWLLRRAEKWAKERGAVSLQMIAPSESPHVGEMYARVGYEPVETMYHKRLT